MITDQDRDRFHLQRYMSMALLNLPNELTIHILSFLTHQDLIACQLSNRALYTTIKTSVLLQYQIALSTFKATDNPSCPLSVSERLQALKGSEDAWTFLRNDFNRRIAVNFEVSGIYDLTGGVFLLGNASRTALHYIKLPSSIEDNVEWKKIQLNPEDGTIIDMGFCLHEHDLLAVVTTYVGVQNDRQFSSLNDFPLENRAMSWVYALHSISRSSFSNCLLGNRILLQKRVQFTSSTQIGIDPESVWRLWAIV